MPFVEFFIFYLFEFPDAVDDGFCLLYFVAGEVNDVYDIFVVVHADVDGCAMLVVHELFLFFCFYSACAMTSST